MGFHIAAALTDYNSKNSSAIIEDPTYGELVFLNKKWDNTKITKVEFPRLKSKKCD